MKHHCALVARSLGIIAEFGEVITLMKLLNMKETIKLMGGMLWEKINL